MGTTPSAPFHENAVKKVKKGEDIVLSWEANTGVYGKWKKESELLEESGRYTITQSDDWKIFKLIIRNAREADEGKYTLELTNRRGKASGSIEVKLLEYDNNWRTIDWGENENVKRQLQEFKPSDVKHLRFLLHGPVGAGKSSIINSINNTFQGRITVGAGVDALSGKSYTDTYRTYNIKDNKGNTLPLVFNDVMGLENGKEGGALPDDIISALKGHVKDGYRFNINSPLTEGEYYNSKPTLDDKTHCLVSVIPANKIGLLEKDEIILVKMRKIREVACVLGIPQVVFMTHVDECCPVVKEDLKHIYSSKRIEKAMEQCSIQLGVPMNCIFALKNYNKENRVDQQVDSVILEALQTIVHYANDFVKDFKE